MTELQQGVNLDRPSGRRQSVLRHPRRHQLYPADGALRSTRHLLHQRNIAIL